jgi:DNA-binding IclR family transcriptional regulator
MRALVDSTGEAVHISVLDGLDVVTIDQVDSTQVLRIHWSTGARSRASRDAFDRELDEIAARGYALQRGELRDDVASVAAPILARSGHPVAAISVFMPAHRLPEGGTRGSARSSPRQPRRSPQGWPSGHERLGIALTAQKRCP